MNIHFDKAKTQYQQVVTHYKEEISALRTGRASSALVDGIIVEAYGSKMPLNQVANISIPEAKMIIITPWDKTVIKDIEKAIQLAAIGINPVNEGTSIRLVMPQMTEENRKELVKLLKQKTEKAKQSARNVREEARNTVAEDEKTKTITQDDKFRYHKEIDELNTKISDDIKKIMEDKEKEIMTI